MPDDTTIRALDDIARQFVRLNERFRMGIAQTSAELDAVFRLRYKTIIENDWAAPSDYPEGKERDDDDERAFQVGIWDGDILAGTGRIILPSPDRALPTESAFGIVAEPHLKVVEASRGIVDSAYGSIQQQIFLGILGQCWISIRERGFQEMCGAMVPAMVRLYRLIGFHWKTLAPPRLYWGEERAPYQLDLERSAESLHARSELFWKKLPPS